MSILAHLSKSIALFVMCIFCICNASPIAHAQEQDICIEHVFNDPTQMLSVESQQPYRLVGAHGVDVLDDYPGLILNPVNRGGVYTVTGGEYLKLPRSIEMRIGRWGAGGREPERVFTTDGMSPGFTRNDMYPEFYPELGLFLMRSNDSIWFRKSEQDAWAEFIAVTWFGGFDVKDMGGASIKPNVWRSSTTGRVAMTLGRRLLLVGHQAEIGDDITFQYHAFRSDNFIKLIHHEATEELFFWGEYNALYNVGPNRATLAVTPWPQPTTWAVKKNGERPSTPTFSETDPQTGDILFRHFNGLARYDGHTITDIPAWAVERLNRYTNIVWVNGRRYARNSEALFALNDDLDLSKIDLPFGDREPPFHLYTKYDFSSEFGRIFLINPQDGRVFTTEDFSKYREVRNDTNISIVDFVSDIPDESSSLLIGENGLYAAVYCRNE